MIVGLFSVLALCVATVTTGESTRCSRCRTIAEVNYEDDSDAASAASGDGTEEASQPRAPYFFVSNHAQPYPPHKDHSLIIDENSVRYFDYTKEQMRAVAEDPNALTWISNYFCGMLYWQNAGQSLRRKVIC
jgi:hypothetical protein